jgi:hypothetical protein
VNELTPQRSQRQGEAAPAVRPELTWPPPAHVRPVLRRARRWLHALVPLERPADLQAILTAAEAQTLAKCGAYPLVPSVLAWIAEPPAIRVRRRRRRERRIAAVVRKVLAAELPEALAAIRESERRQSS